MSKISLFNGNKYKGKRVVGANNSRSPGSSAANNSSNSMRNTQSQTKNGSANNTSNTVRNTQNPSKNGQIKNNSQLSTAVKNNPGKQSLTSESSKKSPVRTKQKKISARKAIVIVMIILIFSITTLMISLGFYVSSTDTVFPNINLNGVSLAGKTSYEVSEIITGMIEASEFRSVNVTINYYRGDPLVISSDEAGFQFFADVLDVEMMADEIMTIGRTGNFFQNELVYIRSLFVVTEISLSDLNKSVAIHFDEEHVRTLVDEHTYQFNSKLVEDALTITDNSIIIMKGTRLEYASADYVFDTMMTALLSAIVSQEDIEIDYALQEEDGVDVDLDILFNSIHYEPVNSYYDPETESATASSFGQTFDLESARIMLGNAVGGDEIIIPILPIPPVVSQEELQSLLFRDILGEVSTTIGGTSNRLNNIQIASNYINELVLNPGDVFSLNTLIGRRTEAKGFRMAPAFESGQLVEQIGGGICQVSSTLYVATLKAELEIVKRIPHGQPISYLPLGQDATVDYDANYDYRFRNNTDFPVRIEMVVNGRTLTAKIIGTRLEDYTIELRTEPISSTPVEVVYQESEEVTEETLLRPGAAGHVVDVYKRFIDSNGNLIREELIGRTTYRMVTRVILVPIPGMAPPPPPTTDDGSVPAT